MRTPILAALLGFSLVACAGQIEGGGGGGDDDIPPPDCGNGSINGTEQCDDGNNVDGDGCSATCTTEVTPHFTVTVDKSSVTTDLGLDNPIIVTVTSVDGFSGSVTLASSVIDAASAPITDWSAALSFAEVTVPEGGTATSTLTLNVPGNANALAGTIKLSATSASTTTPIDVSVPVTANPVVTLVFTTNGTLCKYTNFDSTNPLHIKVGRELKVVDGGQLPMRIHFDPPLTHQGTPMDLNQSYSQTMTQASGGQIEFYCHSPDTLNGINVATDGVNARQRVIIE